MIKIREATEEDNEVLIELEKKCPMGTNLVLGHDSSLDYFARSRAFKDWHVLVATENNRIVGSVGCAIRDTYVSGKPCKTVYEYGFMVDPHRRRKGIATQLQKRIEHLALQKNVDLLHLNVTEGNVPSINLFSKMGFELIKDCTVFSLMVYKRQKLVNSAVRSMKHTDIEEVASIINNMYHDYDFFHSFQNKDFMEYVKRIPYFDLSNILVFEDGEGIKACLGYWDYNKVMKFIVEKFNWRMRVLSYITGLMGLFTKMPVIPKPGKILMMCYLTTPAYKNNESLTELIKHTINIALENNIHFLSIPVDSESPVATVLSKFTHSKVKLHFFVKPLKHEKFPHLKKNKLYIDIVDI